MCGYQQCLNYSYSHKSNLYLNFWGFLGGCLPLHDFAIVWNFTRGKLKLLQKLKCFWIITATPSPTINHLICCEQKREEKMTPKLRVFFFASKQQVMKLISNVTRANKTLKICVTLFYEAKDDQEKWFLSSRDGTRQHYRLPINWWVEREKKTVLK